MEIPVDVDNSTELFRVTADNLIWRNPEPVPVSNHPPQQIATYWTMNGQVKCYSNSTPEHPGLTLEMLITPKPPVEDPVIEVVAEEVFHGYLF